MLESCGTIGGIMNINTGKLISNSELFEKIKEQDANKKYLMMW